MNPSDIERVLIDCSRAASTATPESCRDAARAAYYACYAALVGRHVLAFACSASGVALCARYGSGEPHWQLAQILELL